MIKDIWVEIIEWINNNKRKFLGGLFGFIISILILTIGFFKTLFIIICTVLGYILGTKSYTKKDLVDLLERILPPGIK